MPDVFIPVAERSGLIRVLTRYMLDRALAHRRQWSSAGHEVDIAVNVSVRDLVAATFAEEVADALLRNGCPTRSLRLEITETQAMTEPLLVATTLRRLRAFGVTVSIDDFGTGYSSLWSVRTFDVDEVKIDRTFIARAVSEASDRALVKWITGLGRGLGLRVVAEGVEDDRTLALLADFGVHSVQGFGISRPMPALELPGWLAAWEGVCLEHASAARPRTARVPAVCGLRAAAAAEASAEVAAAPARARVRVR